MSIHFSRIALFLAVGVTTVLATGRASAQTGGTTGTTTTATAALSTSDFTITLERYDSGESAWIQMDSTTQKYFFNRARCQCDADKTNWTGSFRVDITPSSTASSKIVSLLNANVAGVGSARLYSGNVTDCLSPSTSGTDYSSNLPAYCLNLVDPTTYAAQLSSNGIAYFETAARYESTTPIPIAWLVNSSGTKVCGPLGTGSDCDSIDLCGSTSIAQTLYFWVQTTNNNYPDFTGMTLGVNLIGKVNYQPSISQVQGGQEALNVSWTWPTGATPSADTNFLGVQLFCRRGENLQVFSTGSFSASYMTPATLCPDANVATSNPSEFNDLDPAFLCSGLIPSTTNSYRITGLQNGIPYGVGVAAIDRYGNISPIAATDVVYGTPIPTVDFYNEYKSAGGAAQGGFCAVAKGRMKPGLLGLAVLAGIGLVLWRGRRRTRRRIGGGGLLVVLVAGGLTSGPARAQAVYHDNSFLHDRAEETWGGTPREFALEARFALYTPNIDSEFSGSGTKPQSFMFGGSRRPMWQLEFDWEFLQEFGTLAIGGVVGYYKENAQACIYTDLQATGACTRSGDNTSLRLIPLAALVIYRMDEMAEHWKIPLVPYGKVGLNYTIWTVTDGNGNIPTSPGGGHGQGGTPGWQAAVGIALQLDFLDPSAARGFDADSGVNHSYAFFELDHVDGSGLGKKNVLRVGDDTWVAGLMFEF